MALVAMPFVSAWRPSIQLGLLAPVVRAAGHRASTLHLYLDFAALIGPERYEIFCDFGREPVGDWLFSAAAFGADAPDPTGSLLLEQEGTQRLLRGLKWTPEDLLRMRDIEVPRYLDWLDHLVSWEEYDVVGFTTTFQQNGASLALARRLKERRPETRIVLGGANVDGEMGLEVMRIAPWVDFAVAGEAEKTLPALLDTLSADGPTSNVPGVASRRGGDVVAAGVGSPTTAMDDLPVPEYDEYFTRATALRVMEHLPYEVRLPFESSRGCWWGEKHHCTFCGLNGTGMAYRAKSAERTRAELSALATHHGITRFDAVDNILDRRFLSTLLPALADQEAPYRLFFEVKANLGADEVDLLARAGIEEVQPGIESLSSHVLALMDKGVTAAQNVELLRRCVEHGIVVRWNVLYGFPGETESDYLDQVRLMRALHHLPPPESVGRIWMERFSPLFMDRHRFPARLIAPQPGYATVYPAATELSRIAYFFDYELDDTLPDETYAALHGEVALWRAEWEAGPPVLIATWEGDRLEVLDTREGGSGRLRLDEGESRVLATLHAKRRTEHSLPTAAGLSPHEAYRATAALRDRRLVADDGRFIVALPTRIGSTQAPGARTAEVDQHVPDPSSS